MRVLVVEDDGDTRELLSECLEELGFEVVAAGTGRAALDALDAIPPDVILLDLMMDEMDGWTFRAEQRRRASAAGVPVIVMTGLAPFADDGLDAAAVLMKPFTVQAALGAIHAAMRTRAPGGSALERTYCP